MALIDRDTIRCSSVRPSGNILALAWGMWKKRDAAGTLRVEVDVRKDDLYFLVGGHPEVPVSKRILESTWPGRLLISRCKLQPFIILQYLVQDAKDFIQPQRTRFSYL
jgi:hypothetical protein